MFCHNRVENSQNYSSRHWTVRYVRQMYDKLKRKDSDNPTIGILLCTETDQTIAQYSVLNENKQLFASMYMEYLPTEEELSKEILRQKEIFQLQQNNEL